MTQNLPPATLLNASVRHNTDNTADTAGMAFAREDGEPLRHGIDEQYLLQIGDVAKQADLTLRTLRYYEEIGLIQPYERTKGNFRLYHPNVVKRVQFISSLKQLDYSLDEIRDILGPIEAWSDDKQVIIRTIMALQAKQRKIDEKLTNLTSMQREVSAHLMVLESECMDCKQEDCDPCEIECDNKKLHLG